MLSDLRVIVVERAQGRAAVSAAWSAVRVAGLTPRTNHFGLHQSPRSGFRKPSRHYHPLKPALQALTEASSDGKAVGKKMGCFSGAHSNLGPGRALTADSGGSHLPDVEAHRLFVSWNDEATNLLTLKVQAH